MGTSHTPRYPLRGERVHPGAMEELGELAMAVVWEKEAEEAKLQGLGDESALRMRRAEGLTWSPVEVEEQGWGFGGRNQVRMRMVPGGGLSHAFRQGSPVVFYPLGESAGSEEAVKGMVRRSLGDAVEVVWEGDPLPSGGMHGRFTLDVRPDDRTAKLMAEALSYWIQAQGKEGKFRDGILGYAPLPSAEQEPLRPGTALPETFNAAQRAAVEVAWERGPLTLLHGPPGTGKTTVLVEVIRGFVAGGERVLACAPSNAAVDVLAQRCMQAGLNVVRLGHPVRIGDEVLERSLDVLTEQDPEFKLVKSYRKRAEEAWREADRHRRNWNAQAREERKSARFEAKSLEKDAREWEAFLADRILRQAQVVCATLAGAADGALEGIAFDVAVVDEAGQALEPATWIPISRAPRVVLSGDPLQLPPTVQDPRAIRKGLDVSLLEKLMCRHSGSHFLRMLDVQYRMNKQIMEPSSQWFYGGAMQAHSSVADAVLEGLLPWVFMDTAGMGFVEERAGESESTFNREEARWVAERVRGLLELHPEASLGVIAPYRAQVECIEEALRALEPLSPGGGQKPEPLLAWPGLEVSTVDSFQGQERDIMVLSLTRSNEEGIIGFLSEYRRTNVAMTRARKHLLMVGDSSTLGGDPFFGWLIEQAEQTGAYRSAWDQ
ncbi:MAG: hypothetical protein RJA19_1791 [Bacteroidota bacterium]